MDLTEGWLVDLRSSISSYSPVASAVLFSLIAGKSAVLLSKCGATLAAIITILPFVGLFCKSKLQSILCGVGTKWLKSFSCGTLPMKREMP